MVVVINVGELILKGGNRSFFERQLEKNIRSVFSKIKLEKIGGGTYLLGTEEKENIVREKLQKVFGIANFYFVSISESGIDSIKKEFLNLIKGKKFSSFKIEARRADKNLPFDSAEVNNIAGEYIRTKSGAKVDLKNPDITLFADIFKSETYLYFEKISGAGGLPVGSSGKVLSLISSGIDSPVASWLMLKRGCDVDLIHFHSYPQTNRESIENVKALAEKLENWGFRGKLFLFPLFEIQKELFKKLKENEKKYLVLLYRYFMLKIAEEKTKEIGARALVTGDNLGQVASQTISNLTALDKVVDMSIFRPLLGFDKKESTDLAKKIGTYDISIRPADDCCSLFVPNHPETSARFEDIQKLANKVKM